MKQILFALQFKGQAQPASEGSNVLQARTSATSGSISTAIGPEGVVGSVQPAAGAGTAEFESEVTLTGETSFQEQGTITFGGGGHRLRFSTIGEGFIAPSQDAGVMQGAVTWRVESGEGQFANASGVITSNFTVSESGEVVDNQFGVILVA